jgi:cystathionine gamma-synthase
VNVVENDLKDLSTELLEKPVCRAEELGEPIPASRHAVSVALPRWQDVVGYEEKKPEVMIRLQTGYPRFLINPVIVQLARRLGKEQPCLPFPSARAAKQCAKFIRDSSGAEARIVHDQGIYGVVTDNKGFPTLKAFWQHTGLVVSTRQAEAFLAGKTENAVDSATRRSLRRQLAGFYGCAEDDVFLEPSGMAAEFAALQAVMQRTPGRKTVQLGFPYVDTLKLQEKLGHGGILLHHLGTVESELKEVLKQQP